MYQQFEAQEISYIYVCRCNLCSGDAWITNEIVMRALFNFVCLYVWIEKLEVDLIVHRIGTEGKGMIEDSLLSVKLLTLNY